LLQCLSTLEDDSESRPFLEQALDILTTLIQLPIFCQVVLEVCDHDDEKVQGLGLRMLKKVGEEHMGWSKSETALALDMVPVLVDRLESSSKSTETSILALNTLAKSLAERYPHVFAPIVEALVRVVETDEDLKGAACLCWGALCKHVGTRILNQLNGVMPILLSAARFVVLLSKNMPCSAMSQEAK